MRRRGAHRPGGLSEAAGQAVKELGIAPEDFPHIFQTFYTSQIKPVDAQKGIGLGLTISESIVRQHGGRMEAHNRTDGPGAEFIFTLPLKADKEGEEAGKNRKEQSNGAIS